MKRMKSRYSTDTWKPFSRITSHQGNANENHKNVHLTPESGICSIKYYSAVKQENEMIPFKKKVMQLQIIMLSEISQYPKCKFCIFLLTYTNIQSMRKCVVCEQNWYFEIWWFIICLYCWGTDIFQLTIYWILCIVEG